MQGLVFIAGAIVLVLAGHLIRRPPGPGARAAICAFILGLAGMACVIRIMTDESGIDRATEYDRIVAAAKRNVEISAAPYVLFVGSSHSRNGIDDVFLTQEFARRGYPQRVVNMSMQGASYQERDNQLQRFLKATPRTPDIVFLEVSQMYDEAPAYAFQVAKFSDRAIAQMNPSSVGWALIGLAKDYRLGAAARVKDAALLAVHAGLNILNVGLLHSAQSVDAADPLDSYAPQDKKTAAPDPRTRSKNLRRDAPAARSETVWAAGFRRIQEEKLKAAGVREVAYYLPPVTYPEARAFMQKFCGDQLGRHVCIAPSDPKLLSDLDGDLWFDHEHLLRVGAQIYCAWLAEKIDRSGVLK